MAHIRDNVSPGSGKVTYSVSWREGRSQPLRSFKTKGEAQRFKQDIEKKAYR